MLCVNKTSYNCPSSVTSTCEPWCEPQRISLFSEFSFLHRYRKTRPMVWYLILSVEQLGRKEQQLSPLSICFSISCQRANGNYESFLISITLYNHLFHNCLEFFPEKLYQLCINFFPTRLLMEKSSISTFRVFDNFAYTLIIFPEDSLKVPSITSHIFFSST
jgi:hypothetical protein